MDIANSMLDWNCVSDSCSFSHIKRMLTENRPAKHTRRPKAGAGKPTEPICCDPRCVGMRISLAPLLCVLEYAKHSRTSWDLWDKPRTQPWWLPSCDDISATLGPHLSIQHTPERHELLLLLSGKPLSTLFGNKSPNLSLYN